MSEEATVAAHAAIRIMDVVTRQSESLHHGIVTLADMLWRLECHAEIIEQRLERIESYVINASRASNL